MKAKVVIIALALVAMTGTVAAQNAEKKEAPTTQTQGRNYVDANNDGVCDNFKEGTCKGNGQGLRDGSGRKNGQGLKDGSGRKNGQGKGMGKGKRDGTGNGAGKGNFVDANNNGVCDNKE